MSSSISSVNENCGPEFCVDVHWSVFFSEKINNLKGSFTHYFVTGTNAAVRAMALKCKKDLVLWCGWGGG